MLLVLHDSDHRAVDLNDLVQYGSISKWGSALFSSLFSFRQRTWSSTFSWCSLVRFLLSAYSFSLRLYPSSACRTSGIRLRLCRPNRISAGLLWVSAVRSCTVCAKEGFESFLPRSLLGSGSSHEPPDGSHKSSDLTIRLRPQWSDLEMLDPILLAKCVEVLTVERRAVFTFHYFGHSEC